MARDAAQLDLADIYPNVLKGLGHYKGKQIASAVVLLDLEGRVLRPSIQQR